MDLNDVFAASGLLARKHSGYAPRAAQRDMAEAVASALADGGQLVVEAGTGIGKTFAYLVPALLSGRKLIVSTGTKHLQDQLFDRDLPAVRSALGLSTRVALLKGRANYLCLHRLDLAAAEGRFASRAQAAELEDVRSWAGRTQSGDIRELAEVAEDSPLWPRVTSTSDNCLGSDCPNFNDCFVVKARRAAQDAELLVINHHLLFADMALKEEGFGELLPGVDAVIVDEAHQIPEVATQFFGMSIGSRQLAGLARDAVQEHLREAGDMGDLPDAAEALEKAVAELRLAFGPASVRQPWKAFGDPPRLQRALDDLTAQLSALCDWLKLAAPRGRGLENCWLRAERLRERLQRVAVQPPADYVHWVETFTRGFAIHFTPLSVAPLFRAQLEQLDNTWIFTSATLAVGDSFEHYTTSLGLDEPRTLRLDSPFDYAHNALLYLPSGMPEPNAGQYTAAVIRVARTVLAASGGRAFLLFTSHRALQEAAAALREDLDFPLLIQGQAPRAELLARFRALGNAVLLGTGSFWEGVDVRGEALSLVLIDKLPFASPGDPVLQARIDALRAAGGNPFFDIQVPEAVIALKQGAGRLIRDMDDRGVLVLCDPRVVNKGYGRVFRASLPPMPVTQRVEDVHAFFNKHPLSPHAGRGLG
ncbi:MAG: ATP-dependent DNA helicase [Gammaproteobacteria bacterium]|nr:ATP-dependent DNA helicase [Gammaproteobacteria bacterium]